MYALTAAFVPIPTRMCSPPSRGALLLECFLLLGCGRVHIHEDTPGEYFLLLGCVLSIECVRLLYHWVALERFLVHPRKFVL